MEVTCGVGRTKGLSQAKADLKGWWWADRLSHCSEGVKEKEKTAHQGPQLQPFISQAACHS